MCVRQRHLATISACASFISNVILISSCGGWHMFQRTCAEQKNASQNFISYNSLNIRHTECKPIKFTADSTILFENLRVSKVVNTSHIFHQIQTLSCSTIALHSTLISARCIHFNFSHFFLMIQFQTYLSSLPKFPNYPLRFLISD